MHRSFLSSLLLVWAAGYAVAQAPPASGYPVKPVPLPDSAEIALAVSAAPADLSNQATVYAVRDGEILTLRPGTNGSACMVARDFHGGSLYPICFNAEGARTAMKRELMQGRLRSLGIPEDSIDRAVEAAYKRGELEQPREVALAYMMSPRQILFSSPDKDGRRVGAWYPHLMFYMPGATPAQFGLTGTVASAPIQVGTPGTSKAEVIIKLPQWADGTAVGGKP